MIACLHTGCLHGLNTYLIKVEVDLQQGLPAFHVVGLPDAALRECKERVRSAFKNSGLVFPMKRITVNLVPASLRKEGSLFDLAIAFALWMAMQKRSTDHFRDSFFLGELSLRGELQTISGVLPLVIAAKRAGFKKVFVPKMNVHEASLVPEIEIYPLENFGQLISHVVENQKMKPFERSQGTSFFQEEGNFQSIKGQRWAKKALEVAAAGGHHLLFMGPPGCGKTVLAQKLPLLLPPLTYEESLEITQIYSVMGLTETTAPLICRRPFRNPHHTATLAAMAGGGKGLLPGELSLSHRGVLFLDEATEFRRDVLELLREPLEERKVKLRRITGMSDFPAHFLLVLAFNPCPCGNFNHPKKNCQCGIQEVERYQRKVSGPLLDRIDLHVQLSHVTQEEREQKNEDDLPAMRERILQARESQHHRFSNPLKLNTDIKFQEIESFCSLDSQGRSFLDRAMDKFGLSLRSFHKILKIARTLADLEGEHKIEEGHLSQALQFRYLDR
ncbi:MAG: YifB family Mg chelatase-like AAA ATPase [Deltaproteobacteria bacterium]|nr:YifB family Mg chelatase-like AAA ATPase [Deltaproteobacteria bacterium]